MSKLQKKKSFGEKKRRKEAGADGDAQGTVAAKPAVKSSAPAQAIKPKQASSEADGSSASLISRASEFFREVKVELKKVTWPTRKQTTGTTIVVIVFVFVVAAFLGLFDYGLSKLVQVVLT